MSPTLKKKKKVVLEALSNESETKLDMLTNTCNPSTYEMDTGVQRLSEPHANQDQGQFGVQKKKKTVLKKKKKLGTVLKRGGSTVKLLQGTQNQFPW